MMTKRLILCSLLLAAAALFVPATASAQCYDYFKCWGVNCCDLDDNGSQWLILGGPSVCWACGEDPCEGWIECNPAPAPVPEAEALAQLAWSDAVIEEVNAGGLVLLISAEVPPTQPKPLDVADWVAYQRATCPAVQALVTEEADGSSDR
jgi:hypothetical protein